MQIYGVEISMPHALLMTQALVNMSFGSRYIWQLPYIYLSRSTGFPYA